VYYVGVWVKGQIWEKIQEVERRKKSYISPRHMENSVFLPRILQTRNKPISGYGTIFHLFIQ
jgi:hypothetical protein